MRGFTSVHIIAVPVVFSFFFSTTSAQTPTDAFDRGNQLYRKGQFREALAEYESIVKQGYVSPELYFNIGNVYFRLGKIAPAVLAYERAIRLQPNDPDIEYNLKLVSLRTVDRIDHVPELFVLQWLHAAGGLLSNETTALFFLMSWSGFFLSLGVMYAVKKDSVASAMRWLIVTGFVGVVVFGGMMGLQEWQEDARRDQSIITPAVVTAKSSPDDQSVDAFVIHEGLKVRTSDTVGDWIKIVLPDGKVGWIRSTQCERI